MAQFPHPPHVLPVDLAQVANEEGVLAVRFALVNVNLRESILEVVDDLAGPHDGQGRLLRYNDRGLGRSDVDGGLILECWRRRRQ